MVVSIKCITFAEKYTIMALAIKAIPTLYGDDAINFREKADCVEKKFLAGKAKDRSKDSFVVKMHEMLKRSGF